MAPLNFNFAQDVIDRLAAEDRVGLIFVDEHGHRRDYYFAEISQHSQHYAGALRDAGVTAGERVLLCTTNNAKALFTMLALERLGAVPIPCAEGLSADEVMKRARAHGATTVITNRRRRRIADALTSTKREFSRYFVIGEERDPWARLDLLAERAPEARGVTTQLSDPACIIDEWSCDHGALFDAQSTARAVLGALDTDVVWCTLPIGSAAWFANVYIGPWSCGAATVAHDGMFDPRERLDLVRELDVTILMQSPAEFVAQTQTSQIERLRAPRLHRCLSVGEPLDREMAARWSQSTHLPVEDVADGVALVSS